MIAVNDGSTDDSLAKLENWADKIKIFNQANGGAPSGGQQPRRGVVEGNGPRSSMGRGIEKVSDLGSTLSAAQRGDKSAIARLEATPLEDIISFGQ